MILIDRLGRKQILQLHGYNIQRLDLIPTRSINLIELGNDSSSSSSSSFE